MEKTHTPLLTFQLVTLTYNLCEETGRDLNGLPPSEVDRFCDMVTPDTLESVARQMASACPESQPQDEWGNW